MITIKIISDDSVPLIQYLNRQDYDVYPAGDGVFAVTKKQVVQGTGLNPTPFAVPCCKKPVNN